MRENTFRRAGMDNAKPYFLPLGSGQILQALFGNKLPLIAGYIGSSPPFGG